MSENICSRHSCDENNKLKRCKFCEEMFCEKHLRAFAPFVGIDDSLDREDPNSGHPCPPYVTYKKEMERKEKEEYSKNLDKLLRVSSSIPKTNFNKTKIERSAPRKKSDESLKKVKSKQISKKKHKKKNVNKSRIFVAIIVPVLLIGIIFFYEKNNNVASLNENSFVLDDDTISMLNYVNLYRNKVGSYNLTYSEKFYEFAIDMMNKKDIDSNFVDTMQEFREELSKEFYLTDLENSFYHTYFIGGNGIEGFYEEFDKDFGARNIIKDSKYEKIATYCSLDYCLIFVYSGELISVSQDDVENETVIEKFSLIEEASNLKEKIVSDYSSKYLEDPKIVNLPEIGNFEVYGGLNKYFSELPESISYLYVEPTEKDFIMRDLDNKIQVRYLSNLTDKIKSKYSDDEIAAKKAISMVQKIPYDYNGLYSEPEGRMPYEVIYDMMGVCGEKSLLLTYILRDLGYGVAIIDFDNENHRVVGVKCNSCDYLNTGYCFIESTSPTIPTYSKGEYIGAGKLSDDYQLYVVSDGSSLDLSEECEDAKLWDELMNKGEYLNSYDYGKWEDLVDKYDIEVEE